MARAKGTSERPQLPDGDAATLLATAAYRALVAGAEQWAAARLTMPQLKVLLLLARSGSAPVSWLAARMSVSPPNITGILDRLEERGLVRRTNDPRDRRVVRIVLTDEGQQLLRDLTMSGASQFHEVMAALPDETVQSLSSSLGALLEALERSQQEAAQPEEVQRRRARS